MKKTLGSLRSLVCNLLAGPGLIGLIGDVEEHGTIVNPTHCRGSIGHDVHLEI